MDSELERKMIERVRNLLALTASPNEHEAALAAERAQAIVAKYNLDMAKIKGKIDGFDDISIDTMDPMRKRAWRRPLAQAVGHLYFCTYFYVFYCRRDIHSFVGTPANTIVAKLMFTYLAETIERLSVDASMQVSPSERNRFRQSFAVSCAQRLCQRIRERIDASKTGETPVEGGGSNLPVLASLYDQWKNLTTGFMEQTIGKPRVAKSVMRPSSAAGYRAGVEAADRIGLDQQVTDEAPAGLLEN
jgi:hypothetical protein